MFNSDTTNQEALPSTRMLIRSTVLALAGAMLLLVTVVMPAEYGVDPTGVGQLLGLKKMGEIKQSLEAEAAAEGEKAAVPAVAIPAPQPSTPPPAAAPQPEGKEKSHRMEVTLAPNEAAEIKLEMKKGATANFVWYADKGRVNYDIHADSDALKIKYHNYSKGREKRLQGKIEAAFDGFHGWFWRNRTKEIQVVVLETDGEYEDIVRVK